MNFRIRLFLIGVPFVLLPACVIDPPLPPPDSFKDDLSTRYAACSAVVSEDEWRVEIIRLVNQQRAKAGLGSVVQNDVLEAQATQYACEMIQGNFFGHVNPLTGTYLRDRAEEFDYKYQKIGENLAAVPPTDCTPEDVMDYWMNSPGHRANILEPDFTELGVGIRTGGEFGTYWVQEFGRPAE